MNQCSERLVTSVAIFARKKNSQHGILIRAKMTGMEYWWHRVGCGILKKKNTNVLMNSKNVKTKVNMKWVIVFSLNHEVSEG